MQVYLIIVTGVPASGKSSLVAELSALAQADADKEMDVFQIDKFLSDLRSTGTGNAFDADQWRVAQRRMREGVLHSLDEALESTTHSNTGKTKYICIEDNMHYTSMRRAYWKLLRRHAQLLASDRRLTAAMVECRFGTSLPLCLDRNAQRVSGKTEEHGMYVPPDVIRSLYDRFEGNPVRLPQSGEATVEEAGWVHLSPSRSEPWVVLATGDEAGTALYHPRELAVQLYRVLQSPAVRHLLHAQRERITRVEEDAAPDDSSSASAAHVFDLHLRACVGALIKSRASEGPPVTSTLTKQIARVKKEYTVLFNQRSNGVVSAEERLALAEELSDNFMTDISTLGLPQVYTRQSS